MSSILMKNVYIACNTQVFCSLVIVIINNNIQIPNLIFNIDINMPMVFIGMKCIKFKLITKQHLTAFESIFKVGTSVNFPWA